MKKKGFSPVVKSGKRDLNTFVEKFDIDKVDPGVKGILHWILITDQDVKKINPAEFARRVTPASVEAITGLLKSMKLTDTEIEMALPELKNIFSL